MVINGCLLGSLANVPNLNNFALTFSALHSHTKKNNAVCQRVDEILFCSVTQQGSSSLL
jgi:hypothetical protein